MSHHLDDLLAELIRYPVSRIVSVICSSEVMLVNTSQAERAAIFFHADAIRRAIASEAEPRFASIGKDDGRLASKREAINRPAVENIQAHLGRRRRAVKRSKCFTWSNLDPRRVERLGAGQAIRRIDVRMAPIHHHDPGSELGEEQYTEDDAHPQD